MFRSFRDFLVLSISECVRKNLSLNPPPFIFASGIPFYLSSNIFHTNKMVQHPYCFLYASIFVVLNIMLSIWIHRPRVPSFTLSFMTVVLSVYECSFVLHQLLLPKYASHMAYEMIFHVAQTPNRTASNPNVLLFHFTFHFTS